MSDIFEEVELLTITYKSSHIIDQSISGINEKFKITIIENSNDVYFQKKMENRKNVKCILSGENLGFGKAFNLGAKTINSKYIFHFNHFLLGYSILLLQQVQQLTHHFRRFQ